MLAILAAVAIAALAASALRASAASRQQAASASGYCPPAVRVARKGQVALYVYLEVRSKGNVVERGISLALRHYVGRTARYTVPGYAYSGCWNILLYHKAHVPARLCIFVPGGFQARGNQPCQSRQTDQLGRRSMAFFVDSA
jgi:hypothetical protein